MPPPDVPATLFQAKRCKLMRKLERMISKDPLSDRLVQTGQSTLDWFDEDPTLIEGDDTINVEYSNEVRDFMKNVLPPKSEIFTDALYRSPLLPCVVLSEIGRLYNFGSIDTDFFQKTVMSTAERSDKRLQIIVWLAYVTECSPEESRVIINRYKNFQSVLTQKDTFPFQPSTAPGALPPNTRNYPSFPNQIRSSSDNMEVPATGKENHTALTPTAGKGNEDKNAPYHFYTRDTRIASSISSMMKENKFKGELNQSIEMTIRLFRIFAAQNGALETELGDLFVHALDGSARTFYLNNVRPGTPFHIAESVMLKEYNSDARQIRVKGKLELLRLRTFMDERGISNISEGLSKIVAEIGELAPQCHPDYRTDTHKIDYLKRAVSDFPEWSRGPIQAIVTNRYSFNSFVMALHESLQTETELQASQLQNAVHTGYTGRYIETNIGQYGRHPKSLSQKIRNSNTVPKLPRSMEEARRRNLCFRCGAAWQRGHKCENGSIKSYVRGRMERGDTAVHIVADLVNGLEMESDTNEELEEETEKNLEANGEIGHFDDLVNNATYEDDSVEGSYYTNHIASHMNMMEDPTDTHYSFSSVWRRRSVPSHRRRVANYIFQGKCSNPLSDKRTNSSEIHISDVPCSKLSSVTSRVNRPGFCVDIGAPKSVLGQKELNRIFNFFRCRRPKLTPSLNRFRFADSVYDSLGKVTIPLAVPFGEATIFVDMDVVKADIPALLGMDVLDRESITPCTVSNRIMKRVSHVDSDGVRHYQDVWSVPLSRSADGHLYASIDYGIPTHITRTQLQRLHKQFYHPSTQKLFNLLQKARPEDATPQALKLLSDISKRCDPCQRMQVGPRRFQVTIGSEHVRFNERILMDVMYLDGLPVLHIVDEETRFSAASFVPEKSAKSIWRTFVTCWMSIYTGAPNRILVDQGSEFGQLFIHLASDYNIAVERTGVESHSSLGLCERYHQPLRTTYRKIRHEHPNVDKKLALSLSVKAMNDVVGPEGLVPSVLVFGTYPRMDTPSESVMKRPTNQERCDMANTARREMEGLMAEIRLKRATTSAVPPASSVVFEPGDKVLVWRERLIANRIGEWIGPSTVTSYDGTKKLVWVSDHAKPFSVSRVKHYLTLEESAYCTVSSIGESLRTFANPTDCEAIFLTEVLNPSDERANAPEMTEAKKSEVRGLLEKGTFKVVLKKDLPRHGNVLPGRFVLTLKSEIDGKTKFKARYVIGGHRDRMKDLLVHSSTTVQPHSIRLALALSSVLNFEVWTTDVKQAYLQSSLPLERDIYIKNTPPEFGLKPEECLQLLKPLYGLCDSGDLWHASLDKHLREELGLKASRLDPALYISKKCGKLNGIVGTYVDDLLYVGNNDFKDVMKSTREKFEMDGDKRVPLSFTGFDLGRNTSDVLSISQKGYLERLKTLSDNANFSDFRSARMRLSWLSNSRPDALYCISQFSQVTERIFTSERNGIIREFNKAVEYVRNNPLEISFVHLDINSLHVVGFSDASFGNNRDGSSQLGYVVFLSDSTGSSIPFCFKSYKSKRIARSPMTAEVIAFSDLFDITAAIGGEMEMFLGKQIPVQLLTDSKCLFDVISKGSRTSEKRTMLDIAAAREGFKDMVISDIGLVRSKNNLADCLTKAMSCKDLYSAIKDAVVNVVTEQWIIRTDTTDGDRTSKLNVPHISNGREC